LRDAQRRVVNGWGGWGSAARTDSSMSGAEKWFKLTIETEKWFMLTIETEKWCRLTTQTEKWCRLTTERRRNGSG